VQCKYSEDYTAIGKKMLSEVNIPSLIHEYRADGYLLVSNSTLSAPLTLQFERFQKDCKFGYRYDFWDGDRFLVRIGYQSSLWPAFFPAYNKFMTEIEEKAVV
jgi:hypothetical protein